MIETQNNSTFRMAYSERSGVRMEDFERRMQRHCLAPWKRPLATIVSWLVSDAFTLDLDFLRDISEARSQSQVLIQLQAYRYEWHSSPRVKLRWMGLRLSGQRLLKAAAILPER